MEDDTGLLGIEIDSASEDDDRLKPARDGQSDLEFEKQKREWKPKIEHGEIWRSLHLPSDDPSKPESQRIMHAIEELYFLRKFDDAQELTLKALSGRIPDDLRKTLEDFSQKCKLKLHSTAPDAVNSNSP